MPKGQKTNHAKSKEPRKKGRPVGAWSGKPFRDALIRATKARDPKSGQTQLFHIAERMVREARNGDTTAMQLIADRLDGRVSGNTEHGVSVSFVVRMPDMVSATDWAREVRAVPHQPTITNAQPVYTNTQTNTAKGAETNLPAAPAPTTLDANDCDSLSLDDGNERSLTNLEAVVDFPSGGKMGEEDA
jgi:hypothetical protein